MGNNTPEEPKSASVPHLADISLSRNPLPMEMKQIPEEDALKDIEGIKNGISIVDADYFAKSSEKEIEVLRNSLLFAKADLFRYGNHPSLAVQVKAAEIIDKVREKYDTLPAKKTFVESTEEELPSPVPERESPEEIVQKEKEVQEKKEQKTKEEEEILQRIHTSMIPDLTLDVEDLKLMYKLMASDLRILNSSDNPEMKLHVAATKKNMEERIAGLTPKEMQTYAEGLPSDQDAEMEVNKKRTKMDAELTISREFASAGSARAAEAEVNELKEKTAGQMPLRTNAETLREGSILSQGQMDEAVEKKEAEEKSKREQKPWTNASNFEELIVSVPEEGITTDKGVKYEQGEIRKSLGDVVSLIQRGTPFSEINFYVFDGQFTDKLKSLALRTTPEKDIATKDERIVEILNTPKLSEEAEKRMQALGGDAEMTIVKEVKTDKIDEANSAGNVTPIEIDDTKRASVGTATPVLSFEEFKKSSFHTPPNGTPPEVSPTVPPTTEKKMLPEAVMERARKIKENLAERARILTEEGTLLERAGKLTKKSIEGWRGVGEWYNRQDPKMKRLITLSLTAAALGSGAMAAMGAAGVFGGVAMAARLVGSAGTFVSLEKLLHVKHAEKTGEERPTGWVEKRHLIEALTVSVLLGGGFVGDAINNITTGRLAEALGFSGTKTPPVPSTTPPVPEKTAESTTQPTQSPVTPSPEKHPEAKVVEAAKIVEDKPSLNQADVRALDNEIAVRETAVEKARLNASEAAVTPEKIPTAEMPAYTVKSGDNFYKILRANFPEINALEPGRQANAIENILAEIKKNPELYGVKDVNLIKPGDAINIKGIHDIIESTKIGEEGIIEHAKGLSDEAVERIEKYQPPTTSSAPNFVEPRTIATGPSNTTGISPEGFHTETPLNVEADTLTQNTTTQPPPSIEPAVSKLPPLYLEKYFNASPEELETLPPVNSAFLINANEMLRLQLDSAFGKNGFFGRVAGVDSSDWKNIKGMKMSDLFDDKKTYDEATTKFKNYLLKLSTDSGHTPSLDGKESVDTFLKRGVFALVSKGEVKTT